MPMPFAGSRISAAYPGLTVLESSARVTPSRRSRSAVGSGLHRLRELVRERHAGGLVPTQPALIREVVDRGHDRGPRNQRIGLVGDVAKDHGWHGLPVVKVDHVDWAFVEEQRFDRGPAQQPESPAIVRIVPRRPAVVVVAIERGRVVDEADAVAARFELDQLDVGDARGRQRIRHRQRPDRRVAGHDHAPVLGQEHVHRRLDLAERLWPSLPTLTTAPVPSQTCDWGSRATPAGGGSRFSSSEVSTGEICAGLFGAALPCLPPPGRAVDAAAMVVAPVALLVAAVPGPVAAPTARARASTTSPRPPVFAHGSHSALMQTTRILGSLDGPIADLDAVLTRPPSERAFEASTWTLMVSVGPDRWRMRATRAIGLRRGGRRCGSGRREPRPANLAASTQRPETCPGPMRGDIIVNRWKWC